MGENSPQIELNTLLSYCHVLVGVLKDTRDSTILSECLYQSNSLHSTFHSGSNSTHTAISDYQKMIDDCKQKIETAKSEVVADGEIDSLQNAYDEEFKREELLREELRVIVDKISELDHQRSLIVEESQKLKKVEEDRVKEQQKLSFYASVTNIVPDLENKTRIAGHIVKRDKKVVEKFDFDPSQEDLFDICNKTWKMINQ